MIHIYYITLYTFRFIEPTLLIIKQVCFIMENV